MALIRKKILSVLLILTVFVTFSVAHVNAEEIKYSNEGDYGYGTSAWWHRYINTQDAWDLLDKYAPNNKRVIVASIDTGCTKVNPDLQDNLDKEHSVQVMPDGSFVPYEKPDYPHGTGIASIVGATSNNNKGIAGVAAGNRNNIIKLMCINVYTGKLGAIRKNGKKDTTTDNIIRGMEYAAEHGARVIHMCIGHDKKTKDANGKKFDTKRMEKAVKNIKLKYPEIIFVASAGNRNSANEWYMSDFKEVASVINSSHFTNLYSKNTKFRNSNYGKNKDFSAPGQSIKGLRKSWDEDDEENNVTHHGGTSAASAVAAGVAALTAYANPDLDGEQIRSIMGLTAVDLYNQNGFDKYTGCGNVNAYNSVLEALRKAGKLDNDEGKKLSRITSELVEVKDVKVTCKKDGDKIKIYWTKSSVSKSKGYINQYRVYIRSSQGYEDNLIKRVVTKKTTTDYTYKTSGKRSKYYIDIKPYGTTVNGKMLSPKINDNQVEVKMN